MLHVLCDKILQRPAVNRRNIVDIKHIPASLQQIHKVQCVRLSRKRLGFLLVWLRLCRGTI